jgi:hypothetical protein
MFKTIMALVRGRIAGRDDRERREAGNRLEAARRALDVALAAARIETRRIVRTERHLNDLETRALAALSRGREDLAREAAIAIAALEADRIARCEMRKAFGAEIERLTHDIAVAERALSGEGAEEEPASTPGQAIAGVLAAAGFGARPAPSAAEVLLRLKTQVAATRMAG